MKKVNQGILKSIATRGVIAAIPVAMASAYAGNMAVPTPPRMAAYEYQTVAEITVSPTTVGVAASPLYGQTKAQIDQQLDQMQALGVQNIRVFVPWGLVDFFGPSDAGSPSWATLDLVMQSAKEHDMGVMAEVDSTPPYAVTAGTPGSGTPDPKAFAAFMTKFVNKYGSTVSAYEIWNEPNAYMSSNPIDPAAYAALVKAAYQAIKPLDPTATIVAGAVGHVINFGGLTMDPVDFVKAMIAADPTIGQYFDALSYHPYDENTPFSQGNVNPNSGFFASDTAYNQLKDLVALFPTKKVWLSEFGVPTYSYTDANGVVHTVTQDQQEKYIADLINSWGASFGQNAGPIFLYTGRDTATGSSNPNDNYGLWDLLGQPKEVITQFLAQWFKDHPQNAGTTTPGQPPTPPANPFAAIMQVIAQQIQAFQAQLQASIAAFVQAINNFFASINGTPAVTKAAPLSLRVASVATADVPSAGDDVKTVAATADSGDAKAAAKVDESAPAVAEATPKAATAAAVTTPATVETVVAQPDAPTPTAAEPASSTSTTPDATGDTDTTTKPDTTTKSDTTTKPDSTTKSDDSSSTPAKSDDSSSSTKSDKTDSTTKPDTTTKSEKADKTDSAAKADKSDKAGKTDAKDSSSTRPSKDKGDNDASANKVKPKTGSDGAGAAKGSDAKSASHSASGSGSSGGGNEG